MNFLDNTTYLWTRLISLHGPVHLMGTTAYMKLAEIKELPYKTTQLGQGWDLGARGIARFFSR